MEPIAVLVIEKARAKVVRFRVELAGEADWSLSSHTTSEALRRLRPDLVTVVANEKRAQWLAEELRRQGRADTVILLYPETGPPLPGQTHIRLSTPLNTSKPRQLVIQLAKALLQAQAREPANPLTGLPGGGVLREAVEKRISADETFAFLYLDLDNFKAYNDHYGFAKGDEAIKLLAKQLSTVIEELGEEGDMYVHIGGDDFGILTTPERSDKIAEALIKKFDASVPGLYEEPERSRGFIITKDRRGNEAQFPIMTLSIAGASNESRKIENYLHLSEIAAEIKAYAKSVTGSTYVQDRRQDADSDGQTKHPKDYSQE